MQQRHLDAWVGQSVDALDAHKVFNTLPLIRKVTDNGIEIRNYKNSPCDNFFFVKDNTVLEYRPTGRCFTDDRTLPSNKFQVKAARLPTSPKPPSPITATKPQRKSSSTGSGFFISKLGHIVTNQHVVRRCISVTVGDNSKTQVLANILETDKRNDLALLRISSTKMASVETKSLIRKLGISVVPLASEGLLRSDDVNLGERVMVSGYPFGNIFSDAIKVTTGIVSSNRGIGDNTSQFQIDAAVQPGNSGGPIYDENGNIVGVVVAQLNKTAQFSRNIEFKMIVEF